MPASAQKCCSCQSLQDEQSALHAQCHLQDWSTVIRSKKGKNRASTSNHEGTDSGEWAKLVSLCIKICMNASPSLWSREENQLGYSSGPLSGGDPRILVENYNILHSLKWRKGVVCCFPSSAGCFFLLTTICLYTTTVKGTSSRQILERRTHSLIIRSHHNHLYWCSTLVLIPPGKVSNNTSTPCSIKQKGLESRKLTLAG